MKHRTESRVFLIMMLISAITLLAVGCATTGITRAEKTTASMDTVSGDVKQTIAQIDATNASLDQVLKSKDTPAVKGAFNGYTENVAKMEKIGKVLTKDTDELSARGNDYFQEWRKEGATYTNPNIQKLSEERRMHLSQTFSKITQSSAGVKAPLNAYISQIKQIQTYLSNDLTLKGIEAITPIAEKTMRDGNDVKGSVEPMLSSIETARYEMVQSGAAAGGVEKPSPEKPGPEEMPSQ